MGKRSNFERRDRDFYPTPMSAVVPLRSHLSDEFEYIEPCAGAGDLIDHLSWFGGRCVSAFDIEPMRDDIKVGDAFREPLGNLIITNPPWDRELLHGMIDRFTDGQDCWLLFDADWMHTKQASEFLSLCRKVVSVGRVKWIPDSKMTGKDNCCWYYFSRQGEGTTFYGRESIRSFEPRLSFA